MTKATQKSKRVPLELITLPRYCERDLRNANLSFRVHPGACIPLPSDPMTLQFRAAYSAALVDAIAAEDDSDE